MLNTRHAVASCAVLLVTLAGCNSHNTAVNQTSAGDAKVAGARASVAMPSVNDVKPHDYQGLHNVVAYHEGFLSGSAPDGDAGFDTLAAMGVTTIISVDGAIPEVEKAEARGIRYIHLPIGYNGFDEKRKLELVRATRDAMTKGPVYVHCHHGKHRSAGAAGTVAASLGWGTPEAMVERMKVSGTAAGYTGLYACTASAAALSMSQIDAVDATFSPISRPTEFVEAMVESDVAFENLKQIEAAGWKTPADHPDLVPAAEAGRLADLLRVLADGDRAKNHHDPAFATQLRADGVLAQELEDALIGGRADAAALSAQLKVIGASCKECHVKYRD
jgi:protein tyrosine phosphatase (PTP) superfamily phosphohydrolase (DUF442 family)